jgi:hypothetical protein
MDRTTMYKKQKVGLLQATKELLWSADTHREKTKCQASIMVVRGRAKCFVAKILYVERGLTLAKCCVGKIPYIVGGVNL